MRRIQAGNRKRTVISRREAGNVLVFATLAMFVLFGFMGLALDAGYMYFHKRRMQTAADAGALGGAQELIRNASASITTVGPAAKKDTSFNGFTDLANVNGGTISVAVNMPPLYGSKAGAAGYVEVIVTQPQPTMFMQLLNINTATVAARAVAGASSSTGCIYALDSTPGGTGTKYGFFLNGNTNLNMSCGIYSNSNFNCVGGATVISNPVDVSYANPGGYNGGGCAPAGLQPSGIVDDPVKVLPLYTAALADIAAAKAGACTYTNFKVPGGATYTVLPGTYCGGISIDGGSSQNITFASGNYYLVGGGIKVTSNPVLTGANVTFFNTYSATYSYAGISLNGNGAMTFSAPDLTYTPSHPSALLGVLFFQDPTVPASQSQTNTSIIGGGGTSVFDGILYFPTTDLQYSGSSTNAVNSSAGYTILIGYDVKINGGSVINSDYTAIGGNPFRVATFIE